MGSLTIMKRFGYFPNGLVLIKVLNTQLDDFWYPADYDLTNSVAQTGDYQVRGMGSISNDLKKVVIWTMAMLLCSNI